MTDTTAGLLVLVLQALFELLVPHSLGLAAREILIALLVAGTLWLCNKMRDLRGSSWARAIRSVRPQTGWLSSLPVATA